MEKEIFKKKISKVLESLTNKEAQDVLVSLKKDCAKLTSSISASNSLKIRAINPEAIQNASNRFTKLFCDLNRDKILKILEDIKIGKQ